jgi:hypothetical protein
MAVSVVAGVEPSMEKPELQIIHSYGTGKGVGF